MQKMMRWLIGLFFTALLGTTALLFFLFPPAPAQEETLPEEPVAPVQTEPDGTPLCFLICEEEGRAAVYRCGPDGAPVRLEGVTDIVLSLLPDGDAQRVRDGVRVYSREALEQLLEDLGG